MLSTEILAYYRQLASQTLTIVDVETTGFQPSSSRVIEVSVLQASLADGIQMQQTALVNPQCRIPPQIVQFTGITQSMVERAAIAADVFPSYLPWLTQGILTAHNLAFDYPFLQMEFARLNLDFVRSEEEQLCTVQLSRLMLPELRSRSLPNLIKHFQFEVGASHRAAADTMACWLLAQRLLTEMMNEDDRPLLARFARQWIPLKAAAQILQCSPHLAQQKLLETGVRSRFVGRGNTGTWMYPRGAVEQMRDC